MIKFVIPKGEKALYRDQVATKQCYLAMVNTKATMKEVQLVEKEREVLEDVDIIPKEKVIEDLVRYELNKPSSNCFFFVGSNKKERERTEIIEFLKANVKVFVWTLYEMPGIDSNFIGTNSMSCSKLGL